MTATEHIQKIKVLLGLEAPAPAPVEPAPAPAEVPVKLSYKLADGTEIEISALEVGGIVTVAGQPAPAGEHMLEDGTKIVVDMTGVITEIELGTPAPAPAPVDMHAEKFAAIEGTLKTQGEMLASFDTALKSNGVVIAQLLEIVEKMATAPTADPAAAPVQTFKSDVPETKAEKFEGLKKAIQNLKK